jgi:hypothetical protein
VTSVDFEQSGALKVGNVTDFWSGSDSGIYATGNIGLKVKGAGNGITIDTGPINTSGTTATVSLFAPGTVQETNGGAVQAANLALLGGGTFILNNSTALTGNAVGTLAAGTSGSPVTSVDFEQSGTLKVGNVTDFWSGSDSGIYATNTVILTSSNGGITQTAGSISTSNLELSAHGDINIATSTGTGGSLTLAAQSDQGNINITNTDAGSVYVGQVAGVDGLSAVKGAVTLLNQKGYIELDQPVIGKVPLTTSGYSYSILLVADSFKDNYPGDAQNAGAWNALQPGQGRYLVYTNDAPSNFDHPGDSSYDKLYNVSFNQSAPDSPINKLNNEEMSLYSGTNYFLYSYNAKLQLTPQPAQRNEFSPNPPFTFAYTGLIDGDYLYISTTKGSQAAINNQGSSNYASPPGNYMYTYAVYSSVPGVYNIYFNPGAFASALNYQISGLNQVSTLRVLPTFPPTQMEVNIKSVPIVLTFTNPQQAGQSEFLAFSDDGNFGLWGLGE